MSDALGDYQDRIATFKERLKYVEGATGVAVAIGKKVVAVDLFDKPATCRQVWDRLLSGVVFDALKAGPTDQVASITDVEQRVQAAGDLPWQQAEAVGEGGGISGRVTAGRSRLGAPFRRGGGSWELGGGGVRTSVV